jgi:hypothetical protein
MRRFLVILALLSFSLLVAAGCGQYGKRYEGSSGDAAANASQEKRVTDQKFDDEARKADGCTEVEEFDSEGSTHTSDPDEKFEYEANPPHSGDHYEIPAPWGLYDKESEKETAVVHNLEHGHIVISHKGLTDAQEQELLDQARINPFHLVVIPRKANPKNGVFYTAWTAQVFCETPSAAALQYMIDNWRDQGPELFIDDESNMNVGSRDDSDS